MSLSYILREMEVNRPNAEMDIQLGNPNTYTGRVGLKRAAEEALKRLKLQYRNELMSSSVFIVVTGSAREHFTELALAGEFDCFSADPDQFYKDLCSGVDTKLFGRENTKNLFNIVGNLLYEKAMELDLASYRALQFSDRYNSSVNKVEDLAALVKEAINEQVGSEIVGITAVHSIVEEAIKRKHVGTVTSVLLNTSDEKFALDLAKNLKKHVLVDGTYRGLVPNVFLVTAGRVSKAFQGPQNTVVVKTVNEESVKEALTKIKNLL